MKNIEQLGSWIIDHWINLGVLILAFSAITLALNARKSVILNEKEGR